jgi:spore coat polysaccharide biosynthesis protein SpsF
MKVIVVLQARTMSTRLPRKALLPMAGYPSAVLAALRAANQGHTVLAATSDDAGDDELALAFGNYGIEVFRGPLNDVLLRYYLCTSNLPDGSVVIRLTGDNILPDGKFIEELLSAFLQSGSEYLGVNFPQCRLPYGMFGEVFFVDSLRRANASASSAHDREHVGPWMARNCRAASYCYRSSDGESDYSRLRCTIDDADDYNRIVRLFEGVQDPVRADWLELMKRLALLPGEPTFRLPYKVIDGVVHSTMTLGTVQLGMEYGVANCTGKPDNSEAIAMVREAIAHGVTALDTARTYGESEQIIGEALSGAWASRTQVITKLSTLTTVPPDASREAVRNAVDTSIDDSRDALRTNRLATLLLHRWEHYSAWNGAAWQRLRELRDEGKISRLGASVYEPWEALAALQDPDVGLVQLPLNVLDSRWKKYAVDRELALRPEVIVHARSTFLQGLLLQGPEHWPSTGDYNAASCVRRLRELTRKFHRENVADLCLSYVRSQPWVTSLVVGCETRHQLQENLRLFTLIELTAEQCEEVEQTIAVAPDELLNPSKWKIVHA